jgi:hypothetical protein
MSRKNPYPYFDDCEDAFSYLVDEIKNPDFETLKAEMLSQVRRLIKEDVDAYAGTSFVSAHLKSLRKIEPLIQGMKSHFDVYRVYEASKKELVSSFIKFPPFVMMAQISILENVDFVHFFPAKRLRAIQQEGLYGRATPSRLTLTREIFDFYIKGNGYIFAYEAQQNVSALNSPVVHYSHYIQGVASKALLFYFEPDHEYQLIVPIKCIKSYDIKKTLNTADDEVANQVLLKPTHFELDKSIVECEFCGADFVFQMGAIQFGNKIVCADCQDKYKDLHK